MQDDLSMILSGKLNLDATIKNINKQIGQIEKQLNDIDITLNVGNIEKVVSTVSKSAKVMTDTMTKELSQMDKVVNGIFRNLGIDKVSKELRDSLTQMLRGVANGTGDISEDIIARINKLAMESKKNIDYAKAQYKELNMAKISDGESIYNYMKEHKDGKSWGKIKPMSEEFKGIDGFKESLRGLISISNDATMTLENLHSEMAGANLLPKDVADMGNMQDFALYLRDTLNQYRKFREELNDNIKVPDMTDTVFNEIGDALPDIAKLENSFGEVNEEIIDTISNVEKLNQEISGLNKGGYQKGKVTESYSLINGENIKSRTTEYTNAELKDTVKIIEKIIDESNELVAVEKVYVDNIKKRNDEQEKLALSMSKGREKAEIKSGNLDRKEELKQANAINKALDEQYVSQEKLKTQIREIALLKKSAEASIDNIVKSNDGADVKRANELKTAISKVSPEAKDAKLQMREFNAVIKEYGVRSKEASSTTNSFSDSLKRFTAFYGLYDLFQLGKRGVESMLGSIFDLDHALVELQKTSNLTGGSLNSFIKESYQIAGDLARTGTEVIDAAGEFSKAGFGEGELANLAETALLLTNVGDGIKDVSEASGTLISAMKGFGIESNNAIDIVDKINAVSNSTASNFEDISFGLERMSGTLGMAGASIDETIGMFTAVNEVLRNSEIVSSGLSSTFMRMRGLSEETGESVDGLKSKLGDLYSTVGVDMMDQNGQLRDTFDVLDDLSKQWGSLSTNQKQYIATESAGIRQAKVFITLMEQWSTVQGSITTSLNSTGSAMSENEKYLNSLEGKVNNVKSAWEQLSATTINSDFVKGILDGVAGLIRFADELGGLLPIVSALAGALIIFKTTSIIDFVSKFSFTIGNLGTNFTRAFSAIQLYNQGLISTKALTMSLTPVIGALTIAVSALVMAYNSYQQQLEENSRKLQERIDKTKDEIESVNSLVKSYDELKDSAKTDKESRDKLLQVQKDIVKTLGLEKDAIDLVNGSYEDNIDVINRANQKKLEQLEIDAKIKYQEDTQKLDKAMSDVSGTNFFKIRSLANNDEMASARKIAEQMSSEFGKAFQSNFMNGLLGGGSFSFNIDSGSQKEAFAALTRLKELMAEEGFTGTKQYATISEELDKLKVAIDNAQISTEQYVKAQNDSMIQSAKTKLGIDDITKATGEQIASLEASYIAQEVAKNGQMAATQAQLKFREIMSQSNPEYAKYIGYTEELGDTSENTSNNIESLVSQLDEISSKANEQYDSYNLLIDAIEKLGQGHQLTGDEIYALTSAYGELTPKIDETTGQMYLERDALIELAGKSGEDAQQAIIAQINKSKEVAIQSVKRIGMIQDEILAINSAIDAYAMLSNMATTSTGGYRPQGLDDETWAKQAANTRNGVGKYINEIADLYKKAEETANNIGSVNGLLEGKKKGSGSGNKSNDPFKKDVDNIRKTREELEQEIAILKEKMNLANVMGDTSAFEEYSNKMSILLDKMRGLSVVEIGKLEGLKNTYKKQEQLAELETAIQEARKQGFIDERQYQEQMISLINTRYDLEKRAYDDKVKDLELEQLRVGEGSERYKQIEQEKYDMLLQLQQSYLDKARQLQAMGLSQNQEDVRKYIDLYKDAEEERLNMIKARLEKERQLEIDAMNKKVDAIKEQQDATKKLIDLRVEMLKEEGKVAQQKVKDELDAFKKATNEKKRLLKEERDAYYYEKDMGKRNKEISDIQRELDKIKFDNSEWANAERLRLEKELADKTSDLNDKQFDHAMDLKEQELDEQTKLFEEQKQNELDIIEKTLLNETSLRKKAAEEIQRMNKSLYNEMRRYSQDNAKYGKQEFDDLWATAKSGIEEYGKSQTNVLDTMYEMTKVMEQLAKQADALGKSPLDLTGGGGGGTTKPTGDEWIQKKDANARKMQSNSEKWFNATPEERKQLESSNKAMAQEIGAWMGSDGQWYILINGKRMRLYDSIGVRHNGLLGGRVGDGLKPNEQLMKLTKDEWVINDKQYGNLVNNITGLMSNKQGMGDVNINLYGTVTEGAKPMLKQWSKDIKDIVHGEIYKLNKGLTY